MSPEPCSPTYREVRGQAKGSCFWTNHVNVPFASFLVVGLARTGISPNLVTTLSLLTTIGGAAVVYAGQGAPWSGLVFLAMGQVGYALDGADGLLARSQGSSSDFGGWLDLTFDRIAHVSVVCLLMLAWLPQSGVRSDIVSYLAPWMVLLVLSLGYHNGINLRTLIFPRSRPKGVEVTVGGSDSGMIGFAKNVIIGVCDFGFFLFVLAVSIVFGVIEWAVIVMAVAHGIGLAALIVRARQLARAASGGERRQ